jgi:hypothetical protein
MPTGACRPERRVEDRNEGWRPQDDGADSLTNCPGGCLPPTAQQFQIAEMQKWLDLCA